MPTGILLYKSARMRHHAESCVPDDANFGLWYDKFPTWTDVDGELRVEKLRWIKTVTIRPCGDQELIGMYCTRQKKLAGEIGGTVFSLTNESRFVSGLGREHPVENGFAWHHTLGTPYLPGSSIKGIVRAWATDVCGAEFDRLLGPENNGVGHVILLDMLPTAPVKLIADIMTPHYGPYYEDNNGNTAPGDWHSPVPVPFLVCEKGQNWQLTVLPASRCIDWPAAIESIRDWLTNAFAWHGAGAKTAVGYGRFMELPAGT